MKYELGGKIMSKFATLRPKTYSSVIDDGDENKMSEGTKNCVTKQKLKFDYYKHCLGATQLENRVNQLEKKKFMRIVLEKIIKNS